MSVAKGNSEVVPPLRGSRGAALAVASAGAFLAFLDTSIVNVAFPSMQESFGDADRGELAWVLDAYFIVIAALLLPAGALADRLGRRRLFWLGLVGFGVASLLCAAAPSWQVLVGARVLQGIAAAVVAVSSLALVLPLYSMRERATAMGLWGASAALAAALGPPLGGALVELSDWRLVFLVNLPLVLVVMVVGAGRLAESRDPAAARTDLPGAVLAAVGLGGLALGIIEGNAWGWTSGATLGVLAASVLVLGALVRRCLHRDHPLVDPEVLRTPGALRGNLGLLLFSAAFFATILGNILFLTAVWGYSAFEAGLATVPGPLMAAAFAGPAGRLADRFGHRAVIVPGTLFYAAGLLLLSTAGPSPEYVGLWLPGMTLTGIGVGLAFPTFGAAAVASVPARWFGAASAVSSSARQVGAVLGTAALVAIVGEPRTTAAAVDSAGEAYMFAVVAALASGLIALTLRPVRREAPVPAPAPEPARVAVGA